MIARGQQKHFLYFLPAIFLVFARVHGFRRHVHGFQKDSDHDCKTEKHLHESKFATDADQVTRQDFSRTTDPQEENLFANSQSSPFSNARRIASRYVWCSCEAGLDMVTFWTDEDNYTFSVSPNNIKWFPFKAKWIRYKCDGSTKIRSIRMTGSEKVEWASAVLVQEKRHSALCRKSTGRLRWNLWEKTDYTSSIPFTSGTEGYACFKIPSLLVTYAGTVLAFAEARRPDCHDFSETDTVYKRSTDGGKTWGRLKKLVEISGDREKLGECGHSLVVGNISPVQLSATSRRHPNRILVPYTRNNFRQWQVHSDDDGVTFVGNRELERTQIVDAHPDCNRSMSNYFGFHIDRLRLANLRSIKQWMRQICKMSNPYEQKSWTKKLEGPWQFLGVGPGNGIQLSTGRVLVPGYHSYIRGLGASRTTLPTSQLYNNLAVGHTLVSDDDGDTWHVSVWPLGQGANENNLVELKNGSVLANSRSLATGSPQYRLQALSRDRGDSFSPSYYVSSQPQPFNGCQGAMVSHHGKPSDTLYVSSPDPNHSNSILQKMANSIGCNINLTGRRKLTVWRSDDGGTTYPRKAVLDEGLAAQTSLQFWSEKLVTLHEQSDEQRGNGAKLGRALVRDLSVLLPTRFVYREVLDI